MNLLQKLYNRFHPYSDRNITYEKALKSRRWTVLHGSITASSGDRIRNIYFASPEVTKITMDGVQDVAVEHCHMVLTSEDAGNLKSYLSKRKADAVGLSTKEETEQ